MANFSKRTINLLRFSGWYPDRNFETSDYERVLVSKGYSVFGAAQKILSEFGGLKIVYPVDNEMGIMGEIDFTPSSWDSRNSVIKLEKAIGTELCRIGTVFENDFLLVAKDGKVYNYFDYYFELDGDDIVEALENILSGKERIIKRKIPLVNNYHAN